MTLRERIQRHEGTGPVRGGRFFPYQDSVGKWTVGWGRNLSDIGVSREEALLLLDNDILRAQQDVIHEWPWAVRLDRPRFEVVVEMCFNMGLSRFKGFIKFLDALERGDYKAAKREMLDSTWARQVGSRADNLAEIMETGSDP